MATSQWSYGQPASLLISPRFENKRPGFVNRFLSEGKSTIGGMVTGIPFLAGTILKDPYRIVSGERAQTPDIAKAMAQGFWKESFIPALATGHPLEAAHRFSERPFTGTLDLATLGFGSARALQAAASTGKFGPRALEMAGYRKMPDIMSQMVLDPKDPIVAAKIAKNPRLPAESAVFTQMRTGPHYSGDIQLSRQLYGKAHKFAEGFPHGEFGFQKHVFDPEGNLWLRRTHRPITPGLKRRVNDVEGVDDVSEMQASAANRVGYYAPRSKNEMAAKLGDFIEQLRKQYVPDDSRLLGNSARIARYRSQTSFGRSIAAAESVNHSFNQAYDDLYGGITGKNNALDPHGKSIRDTAITLGRSYMDDAGNFDAGNFLKDVEEFKSGRSLDRARLATEDLRKEVSDLKLNLMKEAADRGIELSPDAIERAYYRPLNKLSEDAKSWIDNQVEQVHNADRLYSQAQSNLTHMEEAFNNLKTRRSGFNDRIDFVQENLDEINAVGNSEAAKNFHATLDELSNIGVRANQTNFESYLSAEDYVLNANRTRALLTGNIHPRKVYATGTLDNEFIKTPVYRFRPFRREPRPRFVTPDKDQPGIYSREKIRQLGDHPAELFFSGKDSWDPLTTRNRVISEIRDLYDAKVLENVNALGIDMPYKKYLDERDKGLVAHYSDDAKSTPFVAIDAEDPLLKKLLNHRAFINEVKRNYADLLGADDPAVKILDELNYEDVILGKGTFTDIATQTHKARQAGKLGSDKVYVVPRQYYEAIQRQTKSVNDFFLSWLDKYSEVWRNMILHANPVWYRNNAIGSYFLLSMASSNREALAALWNSNTFRKKLRNTLGDTYEIPENLGPVTAESAIKTVKIGPLSEAMREGVPYLFHSGSTSIGKAGSILGEGKWGSVHGKVINKLNDINAKFFDDPYRMARAFQVVDDMADTIEGNIRLRKGGVEALDSGQITRKHIIESILRDDSAREHLTQQVLGDMIDYQNLSKTERIIVRRFFPFWSWMKGSSKVYGRALYERPSKLFQYEQVGKLGAEERDKAFGQELPEFVQGSVILPDFLQNAQGTRALNLGSANPMLSALDTAGIPLSLFRPGYFEGAQYLNPIPRTLIEQATGRNLFFGTPLPRNQSTLTRLFNPAAQGGGTLFDYGLLGQLKSALHSNRLAHQQRQQAANLPLGGLISDFGTTGKATTTFSNKNLLMNALGIPVKDYRPFPLYQRKLEEDREKVG